MSNNFQFPHEMSADGNNNDLLFSNNGLDTGFNANDAADAFSQSWDAQPDFFAGNPQSDTFTWPVAPIQHPPQQTAYRQPPNAQQEQLRGHPRPSLGDHGAIDPSFIAASALKPQSLHAAQPTPTQAPNTITPEALQSRPPLSKVPSGAISTANTQAEAAQQLHSISVSVPKGSASGQFLVLGQQDLQQHVQSRLIAPFLSVAIEPIPLPLSGSNIPSYHPRKSRAQINSLLANNKSLKASLAKKHARAPGFIKPISRVARLQTADRLAGRDESSSEEYTDDSDSASDDEDQEAPIPPNRPSDLQAATRWDAIKALWRPNNKSVTADVIREALTSFMEDIKAIRARWKTDQDNVDKAEKENKVKDVPFLKERAKSQRDLLEIVLKAAVEHGHPQILANFRRVRPVLQALNVFLRDRSKVTDYNSSLPVAILDFIAHSGNIDVQEASTLGLDKVLQRFSLRGDAKIKTLVKRIQNNIASAGSKKPASVASSATTTVKASPDSTKKEVSPANGIKRPIPSDAGNTQPTKKIAAAGSPVKEKVEPLKKTSLAPPSANAAGAGVTAPKTKLNQIYAKPSSFISSLQSAKRPAAASTVVKPVAKSTPVPKAAPEKKTASKPAAGYSFASMLADINSPKKPEATEQKPDTRKKSPPNETPEEKARRLRKEERRRMRVSWAPEDSLVQVKIFEHDPDEELGHDAAQTRDVGDTKSESVMFKQMQGAAFDLEDDEDGDGSGGDPFIRGWKEPVLVDYTDLDFGDNYLPYGGTTKLPQSPEKTANEEREASVLVAFYTDDADIPPSPKEPSITEHDSTDQPKEFGTPPDHVKERIEDIKRRREQGKTLSAQIASLLPTLPNPRAEPTVPAMGTALSSLLGSLQGGQTSQSLPQSLSVPNVTPGATQDITAILAALNQPSATPQPFASQAPQQQQQQQQQDPQNDIKALLATLGNAPNPGQAQAFSAPVTGGMNSYGTGQPWTQQVSQAAPWTGDQIQNNIPTSLYENPERKRMRDDTGSIDFQTGQKRPALVVPNAPNVPGYKTVPCKYWQENKCRKGAACTFKHGDD